MFVQQKLVKVERHQIWTRDDVIIDEGICKDMVITTRDVKKQISRQK